MKRIVLTQGLVALVDDEDFEKLDQYKWRAKRRSSKSDVFNACRTVIKNGKHYVELMPRVITNAPKGLVVDHINHDTLDNQRRNLRVCSQRANTKNTSTHKDSKSGVKGVVWDESNKKWRVEICVNYKRIWLGRFKELEEAKITYNEAATKYFGEFATLNKI